MKRRRLAKNFCVADVIARAQLRTVRASLRDANATLVAMTIDPLGS